MVLRARAPCRSCSRPPTAGAPAATGWARSPSGYWGGVGDHLGYTLLVSHRPGRRLPRDHRRRHPRRQPVRPRRAGRRRRGARRGRRRPTSPTGRVVGAFGAAARGAGPGDQQRPLHRRPHACCSAVLVEWMVLAWSDRATGDPETNRLVRNRIMAPFEVPLAGFLVVAGSVVAFSRLLLTVVRARRRRRGHRARRRHPRHRRAHRHQADDSPRTSWPACSRVLALGVVTVGVVSAPPAASASSSATPRSTARTRRHRHRAQHPRGHRAQHHHHGRGGRGLMVASLLPPLAPRAARARSAWSWPPAPTRRRSTRWSRRAPRRARSTSSSDPVFLIAGVVFVLVQVGVLVPGLAVPQAQGRRRQPAVADPRQHQARDRLDDPPGAAPGGRRRRLRAHPPRPRRPARRRAGGHGHRPAVVVGVPLRRRRRRRGRHRHRQRPGDPRRRADLLDDHLARRHPLLLDPGPQRQARRRARAASTRC